MLRRHSHKDYFCGMCFIKNGRTTGARTLDPLVKSQLLYRLSYRPIFKNIYLTKRMFLINQTLLSKFELYTIHYYYVVAVANLFTIFYIKFWII